MEESVTAKALLRQFAARIESVRLRFSLFFIACCIAPVVSVAESPVTLDSLIELIQTKKLTSIEAVLAELPESYRSSYTLAYNSKSLHGSSLENPRVIMFGPDAQFIITFNGEPSQAGYNQLEVMQYRMDSKSFEFREITFDREKKKPAEISNANPEKCATCHAGNAEKFGLHPLWGQYPHWIGMYGEFDDQISEHNRAKYSDSDNARYREFLEFQAKKASHARYKFLPGEGLYPYSDKYKGDYELRPNLKLTHFLHRYNVQRLASLIKAKGVETATIVKSYLSGESDGGSCDGTPLHDEALKTARNWRRVFPYREAGITYKDRQIDPSELDELKPYLDGNIGLGRLSMVEGEVLMNFLSSRLTPSEFERLKVAVNVRDTQEESNAHLIVFGRPYSRSASLPEFVTNEYAFWKTLKLDMGSNSSSSALRSKVCSLIQDTIIQGVREKDCIRSVEVEVPSAVSNSLRAIQNFAQSKELMRRCAHCHVNGTNLLAPPIPFDDPAKLAQALKSKSGSDETLLEKIRLRISTTDPQLRMPRDLADPKDPQWLEDRKEIERYLKEIQ